MAKGILSETYYKLVLDTPRHNLVRGLDVEALGTWQHALRRADIFTRCLPFIPYDYDADEQIIEENVSKSEKMLRAAGGLVIAQSTRHVLELDRSVQTHIEQAADAGLPIFTQIPLEEINPSGWEIPPAEVLVYSGFPIDMIKQRLEGEL